MICPRCGTENGDSSLKCVKCWRRLTPVEKGPWLGKRARIPETVRPPAPAEAPPPDKRQAVRFSRIGSIVLFLAVLISFLAPLLKEKVREGEIHKLREKVREELAPYLPLPKEEGRRKTPEATAPLLGRKAPGVAIPYVGATVTGLRFFEGGLPPLPRKDRIYADRFPKEKSRFVFWELTLAHPSLKEQKRFRVEERWYGPDGAVLARQHLEAFVEPSWVRSYHNHGWGWDEAGRWPPGRYRLELSVDGETVAEGAFEVS